MRMAKIHKSKNENVETKEETTPKKREEEPNKRRSKRIEEQRTQKRCSRADKWT